MRLKKGFDTIIFLGAIEKCQGDVIFRTLEGDRLNLKSILHRYVFCLIAKSPEIRENGQLECSKEDAECLKEFIEEN